MRPGVRLGVDVGTVRVGVAGTDPSALLATPVETVARDEAGGGDLRRIAELAAERDAVEVIVGLPRSMSGGEGPAAAAARAYARALAARLAPVPVRLVDERLTTVTAARALRERGTSSRKGRAVIDAMAAVVLLQSAVDTERGTGLPPGTPVDLPGERSRA